MANGAVLILTYAVTLTLAQRPCDSETLLISESSVSEWINTKNKTLNRSTKLGIHSSTKTMFLYILLQTSAVKSYNGGSTKPGIVEDWSRKGLQGHRLVSCVLFHSMCDPPSSIYHTSSNLHATKPITFVFTPPFFSRSFQYILLVTTKLCVIAPYCHTKDTSLPPPTPRSAFSRGPLPPLPETPPEDGASVTASAPSGAVAPPPASVPALRRRRRPTAPQRRLERRSIAALHMRRAGGRSLEAWWAMYGYVGYHYLE